MSATIKPVVPDGFYDADAGTLRVPPGTSVSLVFDDEETIHTLHVQSSDSSVVNVSQSADRSSPTFDVTAYDAGVATINAIDEDGPGLWARLDVIVDVVIASSAIRGGVLQVPYLGSAEVSFAGATQHVITSADPSGAPIVNVSPIGPPPPGPPPPRTFAVQGNSITKTTIEVKLGKNVVKTLPVEVGWRGGPSVHVAPADGDGSNTAAAPLGAVPDELIVAARDHQVAIVDRAQGWADDATFLAFEYFLRAYAVGIANGRNLSAHAALLLVAQVRCENSDLTGPNVKGPTFHNNYLSFQPSDGFAGPNQPKSPALDYITKLKTKYGIDCPKEPRDNTPAGTPPDAPRKIDSTPVPHYSDIDQSIVVQLDLVLTELFPARIQPPPVPVPSLLDLLQNPTTPPQVYGERCGTLRYGNPYGPLYVDQYNKCRAVIQAMLLNGIPSSLGDAVVNWGAQMAAQL